MNIITRSAIAAFLLSTAADTCTVNAQNEDAEKNETSYIVNPTALRQKNEGWGVSLCWWANMCGKWTNNRITTIVNWLTSPKVLNYNIFRYNIGGGDDPENKNCTQHHMGAEGGKGLRAEMEGFKDSSDGEYVWSRDEAQRKIMLKIKEKRPDAIFEAFSNSAPYYMTYSGCCAGNVNGTDNLKPEYYEEFAHYLVDVCKHYKDEYGIEFRTLEPFNEPQSYYWSVNGSQEGCHFNASSQVNFLKVLSPILKESGLNTMISASDESYLKEAISSFEQYQKDGVLDLVGQWNTHTYGGSDKERSKIGSMARDAGKRLWMSETGDGGEGIAGNLNMAQRLINDIRYIMPDAWVDWQYVEEWNDQWCLVKANFGEQTYERTKNFYVRMHFSQYIKQGYTYIATSNPQTLAAVSENADTLVLVAINPSSEPVAHEANLIFCRPDGDIVCKRTTEKESMNATKDYTLENNVLRFTLPKLSVVTFVIPVKTDKQESSAIEEDVPYMIVPQYNAHVCLSASNGNVSIEECATDLTDVSGMSAAQTWFFHKDGDAYTLQNRNGDILTGALPGYYLTTKKQQTGGQKFIVSPVEKYLVKITTEDGVKALDLESESYSGGTRVGLWDYGTSVAAGHRNWLLLRLPDKSVVDGIGNVKVNDGNGCPFSCSCDNGILNVSMNKEVYSASSAFSVPMLTLYSPSGDKLLEKSLSSNSITLPLAKGLYIVCIETAQRIYSNKILMK
ncbi:MAG: hypothetical protein LUD00_11390 [Prevotellaceae bacterium]|nr:hypothetical protein [Prevotellaceae bacterium]